MLKKLALVVLFGLSNLHATDTPPKTGFIQRVKNSRVLVKMCAIIPSVVTCISMEAIRRTYKDNPAKSTLVKIASVIECISLLISGIFCRWLLEVDFLKWTVSDYKKEKNIITKESS